VLYLANPSTQRVRDAMTVGLIGMVATPKQGQAVPPNAAWCADNGCFGKGYPGDDAWIAWLDSLPREGCLFAVAPDVVGDAGATLERSAPWLPRIRELGFPAAFVAQNGLEDLDVPWDAFDVLFIGGDTAWKLGTHARQLVAEAKTRGKRIHMGRVNSDRRYRYALSIGCDTVDGTYIAFGPDRNLPHVLAWSRNADQLSLLGDTA
jgi:hypothetical protein